MRKSKNAMKVTIKQFKSTHLMSISREREVFQIENFKGSFSLEYDASYPSSLFNRK